ncbi:MAG TPA: condensation domain-containing protein, partial [Thermoanaerobaculia bacterium]|nr:condensation domain-containing protein [Thermoanaerobaculia bacterium]
RPELEAPRPYREYVAWLAGRDLGRAEDFWRRRLAGFRAATTPELPPPAAGAPAERPNPRKVVLPREDTARLQQLAATHQLTLNTVVQGAWALLLAGWSGASDVVFGATVSGRPAELPGVETMIGLFINTLPVRARLDGNPPAAAWLAELQRQQVEAREFEYSPLAQVQRWSEVPRDQPLFETIVVYENYPRVDLGRRGEERLAVEDVDDFDRNNYPLYLTVIPREALTLWVTFDEARFHPDAADWLLADLELLLSRLATTPETPVEALCWIVAERRRERLGDRRRQSREASLDKLRTLRRRDPRGLPAADPKA